MASSLPLAVAPHRPALFGRERLRDQPAGVTADGNGPVLVGGPVAGPSPGVQGRRLVGPARRALTRHHQPRPAPPRQPRTIDAMTAVVGRHQYINTLRRLAQ